jgi:methylated-DNA-[protein]-cysteine S-methyltransferase
MLRFEEKAMPTPFQMSVYNAIRKIPRGKVGTYKSVAEYLRCRSSRAVGQALRCNPYAPEVPCHRVIASDLTIGGFCGDKEGGAIARKRRILAAEGVEFRDGRLSDPERVYRFPSR